MLLLRANHDRFATLVSSIPVVSRAIRSFDSLYQMISHRVKVL